MNKELLCRLCLSKDTLVNIFEYTETASMINRCCPAIEIMENDQFPQDICMECLKTLGICDNFITKCIESDRLLRRKYNECLSFIKVEKTELDGQYEINDSYIFIDENNENPITDALVEVINTQTDDVIEEVVIKVEENEIAKKKKKPNTAKEVFKNACKKLKLLNSETTLDNCKTVKKFPCNISGKNFMNSCSVRRHILTHSKKVGVKCNMCNRTFSDEDKLLKHVNVKHKKPELYECKGCGAHWESRTDWDKHNKHLLKNGTCLNKVFDSDIFECDICNKTFSNRSNIRQHISSQHAPNAIRVCDICGKSIKASYLREHIQTHSVNMDFSCHICSRAFKCRRNLVRHQLYHTSAGTVVECDICNKTFKNKQCIKVHISSAHLVHKIFKCKLCGKKFNKKSTLASHSRMHTQERPYQCRFCDSKFALSGSLLEHERLHLGITPYKCPSCPKAFTQLGNMKSHFKHNHKDIVFSEVYKPNRTGGSTRLDKRYYPEYNKDAPKH